MWVPSLEEFFERVQFGALDGAALQATLSFLAFPESLIFQGIGGHRSDRIQFLEHLIQEEQGEELI